MLLILPGKYRIGSADWVEGMASPLDERSKHRACELWDSPILNEDLVGTVEGLKQIHAFLFDRQGGDCKTIARSCMSEGLFGGYKIRALRKDGRNA